MFRPIVLIVTLIYLINTNGAEATESIRDVRSLDLILEDLDIGSLISSSVGNIGSIISFLKSQIRDIILDFAIEIFKFLRSILHEYKVKLFKRLANYTLSDVFHFMFDGIFEFVGDTDYNEISVVQNEENHETSIYDSNNEFSDSYLLDKLIRSTRNS